MDYAKLQWLIDRNVELNQLYNQMQSQLKKDFSKKSNIQFMSQFEKIKNDLEIISEIVRKEQGEAIKETEKNYNCTFKFMKVI